MPDISDLEQRTRAYCEREKWDEWKVAHASVEACYALEDALARGIRLFKKFSQLDRDWQHAADSGAHLPTQDEVDRINRIWDRWCQPCAAAEAAIQRFEDSGYKVDGSMEYLACCKAARERAPKRLPAWQVAVTSPGGTLFGKPALTEAELRKETEPFPD